MDARSDALRSVERIQVAFAGLMLALQVVFWSRLPAAGAMIALYAVIIALTLVVRQARLRLALPIIVLLVIYESLGQTIPYLMPTWLEPYLAHLDRAVFGIDPSLWVERL